jgi:hypothetical protein
LQKRFARGDINTDPRMAKKRKQSSPHAQEGDEISAALTSSCITPSLTQAIMAPKLPVEAVSTPVLGACLTKGADVHHDARQSKQKDGTGVTPSINIGDLGPSPTNEEAIKALAEKTLQVNQLQARLTMVQRQTKKDKACKKKKSRQVRLVPDSTKFYY